MKISANIEFETESDKIEFSKDIQFEDQRDQIKISNDIKLKKKKHLDNRQEYL